MFNSKFYLRVVKIPTIIIICLATLLACARVKHPEGGPKDETAPVLVSCNPTHGQVSFEGQELILTFDKEVEIRGLNKIKISPSPQKETNRGFTCKARENTVRLKFDEKLKGNTTYTVNFADAIVSLSEEIPVENLVVTFSTGVEIDEMKVSGTIVDLLTNLPVAGAYVLLYAQSDEAQGKSHFNEISQDPNYFIKSDKEGKFTITNIKKGKYRTYATFNSSGITKLSPSTDKYGTILDPIDLEIESASNLFIPIVFADINALKVVKANQVGPHAEIILNKPVEEYNFDKDLVSILSHDKKSIYIYNVNNLTDSINNKLSLNIYAKDNTHNVINEQIEISLNEDHTKTIQSSFRITPTDKSSISEHGTFIISSTKPMMDFDSLKADGIMLYLNENPIFLSAENLEMNDTKDRLYINYDVSNLVNHEANNDTFLILRISENTLLDIDGNTNREITNGYRVKNPKRHGSISGTIYATSTDSYKIQLVTMDEKITDEIESTDVQNNTYKFELIEPGKYFVRILCYKDLNTFWSPGNHLKGTIPDPVYIYPAPVEVLENWDIKDIDFNIE